MTIKSDAGYSTPTGLPVIHLNANDARLVKGMLKRGDRVTDIAAYFGVDPAQVCDINLGRAFAQAGTARKLPPKGPYVYEDFMKRLKTIEALLIGNKRKEALAHVQRALGTREG